MLNRLAHNNSKVLDDYDEEEYEKINVNDKLIKKIKLINEDYYNFVLNNKSRIKYNDKIFFVDGYAFPLYTIKKCYYCCCDDIYTIIHELMHGYQYYKNNNLKFFPDYNFYHEIFPHSIEIIFSRVINDFNNKRNEIISNFKDVIFEIDFNDVDVSRYMAEEYAETYQYLFGILTAIKLDEIFSQDKEKYTYYLNYFNNNFYKFIKLSDLRKIGFDIEEAESGELMKKFILNNIIFDKLKEIC